MRGGHRPKTTALSVLLDHASLSSDFVGDIDSLVLAGLAKSGQPGSVKRGFMGVDHLPREKNPTNDAVTQDRHEAMLERAKRVSMEVSDLQPVLADAVRRYGAAAELGLLAAKYLLGCCHAHGIGVAKNAQEAQRWFTQAADGGYDLAREALAAL